MKVGKVDGRTEGGGRRGHVDAGPLINYECQIVHTHKPLEMPT